MRLLRKQAEEVNTEWDKLNLHSADWQRKVDEALERLQELQEAEDELDLKLRQAEVLKGSWQPVGDLLIDSLQDHLEKVKVLCFALRDLPKNTHLSLYRIFFIIIILLILHTNQFSLRHSSYFLHPTYFLPDPCPQRGKGSLQSMAYPVEVHSVFIPQSEVITPISLRK